VLVVGGGPAGLSAALTAARGGSVLVVHRDRKIGRPVRTSGGSWRKHLTRLNLPESLYHPLETLTFAGPTEQFVTRFGEDRPVILDVTGTYQYLARLAAEAGARIECRTSFDGIVSVEPDRVACRISGPSGGRSVSARYVVDASGQWKAVLTALGVAERPHRLGIGVEHEYESLTRPDTNAVLFVGTKFAPAGYGWVFPTLQGTVRVGIGVIRPDSDATPGDLMSAFLKSDQVQRMGLKLGDLVERHGGITPSEGPSPDLLHGRVIAVGDTVGQVLPLVGEGIRYCIESGRKAGEAIADALQTTRDPEIALQRYSRWWNATYQRPFELAQKVNRRIAGYEDPQWDERVRLMALMNGDEMAAFLRMDLTPRQGLGLLLRHPFALSGFGWRWMNRLRSGGG
jgi:digeranylgeranylglycerophospholipid reductase